MQLLEKPHWNVKDISKYTGYKTTKCYEIFHKCIEKYGGGIKGLPNCVKRDSVLSFLGTTIERELYIQEEIKRSRKGENCGTKLL